MTRAVSIEPMAGRYLMPLVRGGVLVPVRIWFGPPPDPETRAPLDRTPRWNCEINGEIAYRCTGPTREAARCLWCRRDGAPKCGELIDVYDAWPYCARRPVDEAEYRYRLALRAYAESHEPDAPAAQPGRKVDWLRSPVA